MTIEEKNKIMNNIKSFCSENSGNRLSSKWLIPALLGSCEAICDECIGTNKEKNNGKVDIK